jgi:Protein of unknown function (DUF3574)
VRAINALIRSAAILLLLAGFAGGAGAQLVDCRGGQKPTQVAEMMFGRKIGDRIGVSEAQWSRFVDREITPRFPDGLTVFDTKGQWRDRERNRIVREPSKLVSIVLPGKGEDEARLNEIAAAYKSRFQQQSVAIVVRGACVSF